MLKLYEDGADVRGYADAAFALLRKNSRLPSLSGKGFCPSGKSIL